MGLFTPYSNLNVYTAFIPELYFGWTIDNSPVCLYLAMFQHIGQRMVPTCLACCADNQGNIARQLLLTFCNEFKCRDHCCKAPLLLACAPSPDTLSLNPIGFAVNYFTGIRFQHRTRHCIHGITYKQKPFALLLSFERSIEVPFVIYMGADTCFLQLWVNHIFN